MAYIIDKINLLENNKVVKCSILIQGSTFRFIENNLDKFRFMKMDLSAYLMTPGFAMIDQTVQHLHDCQTFKKYLKHLILKGCTFLIAAVDLSCEREWNEKERLIRKIMMNSSIDYSFAAKVPLKRLNPPLVRMLKRRNIPLIIVDIKKEDEFEKVVWEWVREALFPVQTPIFPHFSAKDSFVQKHLQLKWSNIVERYKLPSVKECPKDGEPLEKDALMKIGLYPLRCEILCGSNVDYNLFPLIDLVEKNGQLDYDNHNPEVIVHNGIVLKAGERIFFRPGAGKEIRLTAPGRFKINSVPHFLNEGVVELE